MNLDYKLTQLQRFLVSRRLYGISSALKMLLRAGSSTRERRFLLPNGNAFYFRGKVDVGVVSHFAIEGYFIRDSPEKPVLRIIDAGANIGDETARFHLHYPKAEIVAIEPEDENFRMLKKNFGFVPEVRLIHGGLWSSECHLKVVPAESGNLEAFRVVETSDSLGSIKATTIDSIMQVMKWEEIDVLKLDIEGSEHEIFTRNFESWVDKVNAFIIEVPDSDHPGTTQEIYKALEGQQFNSYVCGENLIIIRQGLPWKYQKVNGLSTERLLSHRSSY
jgi:FkbM family methyltransferase